MGQFRQGVVIESILYTQLSAQKTSVVGYN